MERICDWTAHRLGGVARYNRALTGLVADAYTHGMSVLCRARVLALVLVLAVSQILVGCNALEEADKRTDELLDKVNEPGGSSSSSSRSSSTRTGSGLEILKRRGMTYRGVTDEHGRTVQIWGQTKSASTTPGHDKTMNAKATDMARSGDYKYITLQRSWRTATHRVGESRNIPDIIGVRRDDTVDAFEVRSRTDTDSALRQRLREGMNSLPAKHRGDWDILLPDESL